MANFSDKLRDAARGDVPSAAALTFLSDLSSEDRATFREIWPLFARERRRRIVENLVWMSEENIELDFRHVFLTMLDDQDAEVRRSAIEGLFEDESKLLLGRLMEMLRLDPDETVREAAATSLGRFTYLAQCDKLGDRAEPLRQALVDSARDESEESGVRRRAVEALGYFSEDAEVQELISDAYGRGGKQAESAVFAMGRSMDERWQQIVLDELESERPSMRYEAAHAAGEMMLESALPRFALMLDDDDLEVRLAVVWALGQIGGKPAAQLLVRALRSEEPAMREAAEDAMQELAFAADPLKIIR